MIEAIKGVGSKGQSMDYLNVQQGDNEEKTFSGIGHMHIEL